MMRDLLFPEPSTSDPLPWPTQTDIAKAHKTTTVAVHQVLAKSRDRWRRQAAITEIRNALFGGLLAQGGIASLAEAAQQIGDAFPGTVTAADRDRFARALLRAAVEAESALDEPRFEVNRRQDRVWLVAHQDADGQPIEASDLLRFAQALGTRAHALAHAEPLPPPARVLEALQQVQVPEGLPAMQPERLVRLAATAANVAVSGRLELYPRNMPAARALKLAHGALLGATELTLLQVRERIHSRYPEAEALPADLDRLQSMLRQVVPDLQWDTERSTFRFQSAPRPQLTGERTIRARASTGTLPPPDSPEILEAKEFDERLQKALAKFLVLTARREEHETVLQRIQDRFPGRLQVVSCEHELLQRLRAQTEREGIAWQDVLAADGEPLSSPRAKDLRQIVLEAAGNLGDQLGRDLGGHAFVLTRLGILARYGLLQTIVDRLRERAYLPPGRDGALAGVWLLIATSGAQDRPTVDGTPVPVPGGRSDYAEVPRTWVYLGRKDRAG